MGVSRALWQSCAAETVDQVQSHTSRWCPRASGGSAVRSLYENTGGDWQTKRMTGLGVSGLQIPDELWDAHLTFEAVWSLLRHARAASIHRGESEESLRQRGRCSSLAH